ncbi:aminotransferase class I/II-fold pyridoxal phosphate-dependent enzyme [Roseisolibacter sp. H3M3-2]|uniref:aminotransferase class I/II-fold pyridoxal phosphate-dependent enzyme n=1 Tax=Roseisolibacter sp. H3M3-2 TaxID=3031323 RepID=UPI0023DC031A|nr:aminotransferase class I/II-fold pyridoxal phosphate-dependent enzyme [Roseisolibacter sp. H3M3-2]MDF1503415.1 aminotransferase class I/II-fold pyridoxal phosphate-dependent enzyme [Roseisolibacter sp. H3M3-2]
MLPRPIAALDRLPPYVFAELDRLKAEARARGRTYLDLGIGSPDRPMPAPVIEALQGAAADVGRHGYPPFRGTPEYLAAAARYLGDRFGVALDPSRELLAVSGSKEGIAQLLQAYCGPGDVALVPAVYYPVYARAPMLNGADAWFIPTPAPAFLPDLDAIPADVLARAKALVVNYPNNPTGAVCDLAFLERCVAFARRHGLLLLSDLAYAELAYDGYRVPSVLQVPGATDVAVELYSCSKSFNMAGVRIGFAAGSAEAIDALAAYRTNVGYGTPWVAQAAGAAALARHAELAPAVAAEYRARRDAVYGGLAAAGWDVTPPSASMYAWLPVPEGFDDWGWVRAALDEAGVVVTPGIAFGPGGAGWFRISLVQPAPVLADAVARLTELAARVGVA